MIYQTIFIQEVSPELTYLSHDKIEDLNPLEAWKFINYINPHRGRYIHQYRIWIWYNHWLEIRYPPHVSTICWLDIPTNLLVESTISISHEHLDLQIIFNILQLFFLRKNFTLMNYIAINYSRPGKIQWSQDRHAALTDGGWSLGFTNLLCWAQIRGCLGLMEGLQEAPYIWLVDRMVSSRFSL